MSRTADSLTLPTAMHSGTRGAPAAEARAGGPSPGGRFRSWASSLTSRSADHHSHQQDVERDAWWKIHFFRGMVNDVRRRVPYYWSDWRDAWDYRVVPSTIYMYFAKTIRFLPKNGETNDTVQPSILPALAFSLDMFTKTNMQYGVNEVLLASVLGAVVFAILACQPLVIVGVTGPITVFN
ncbi:hypothetical protein AAE478_004260 [Parahypoxylon ruwenzoriense]